MTFSAVGEGPKELLAHSPTVLNELNLAISQEIVDQMKKGIRSSFSKRLSNHCTLKGQ